MTARHQAAYTLETDKGTTRRKQEQHKACRIERTTQPAKTSDSPWTGWTNFEEHQEFATQLEPDDEEQQQGTKAKVAHAPKQPTQQEILEHNVTHLPCRNWCSICVEARGRQNNHPKQHRNLPIVQLGFGYIKGFDDTNIHANLTETDIQSGMIMAIQPQRTHHERICHPQQWMHRPLQQMKQRATHTHTHTTLRVW